MNILSDSSLPDLHRYFKAPDFNLSCYDSTTELNAKLKNQDVLLCRSTLKVDAELLENINLSVVATASSGSDHLDKEILKQHNIPWFDAKGSNASAVADYVLSIFAFLNLTPKASIGIMGMGHVGSLVARRLQNLGFDVTPYDPPKNSAARFEDFVACDVLCIHANLHDVEPYPTRNFLSHAFFDALKPNTVIINAARGGIIDEEALLAQSKPLIYCTDVYQNEPDINPLVINKATLCTPHIAGHSIEAKRSAVFQVANSLYKHIGMAELKTPHVLGTQYEDFNETNWQAFVRALYTPIHESKQLKSATDLQSTFLALRGKHQNRHDFGVYQSLSPVTVLD